MGTKHNDWKVLRLFTAVVIAGIVSSALLNAAASVQATTISELTIEERLARVRENLKQRGEELTDPSHPLSSLQENLETEDRDTVLGQWLNWPDWLDWVNWRKWNKWGNWPNWINWFNW